MELIPVFHLTRVQPLTLLLSAALFCAVLCCAALRRAALCLRQIYINCAGGSTYSVLAIYDAMAWVGA